MVDFTNDQGVHFALHDDLTDWAQHEDVHGTALPTVYCWLVTIPDGAQTLLLMDGGTALMDSTQVEAIAVRIDMMKAARRMASGG